MQFGYTIFYVEDVVKTVRFYETCFGMKLRFLHESHTYAEMETGQTRLAFASRELAKSNGLTIGQLGEGVPDAPFEIALVTREVQIAFDKAIENGAIQVKAPVQKPWGQWVGYLKDCNGFIVELCSPQE